MDTNKPRMESKANCVGGGVPKGVELKPIAIAPSKYFAGSDGNIYCYSMATVNIGKPQPFKLSSFIGSTGYPFVTLIIGGQRKSKSVHSLVCHAFHGAKQTPNLEVRHLDGTRTNSLPENLAWGTPADNEADKRRHGRTAQGSKHGIAKLNEEAVRILRVAIPAGLWNPVDAAKVFNVHESVIRKVCAGKSWKHVIEFQPHKP